MLRISASSAGGNGVSIDPLADLARSARQRIDVIDIQRLERCAIRSVQPVLRQKLAEGVGRGGETARHAHARLVQLADHFAQRRILAADLFDVGHAHFSKGRTSGSMRNPFKGERSGD
jgi:hypothetical protein